MTMQYIREHYDQRFKRGVQVQVRRHGKLYAATVIGSDGAYLRLRLNYLEGSSFRYHPNDIEKFLPDEPAPLAVQP